MAPDTSVIVFDDTIGQPIGVFHHVPSRKEGWQSQSRPYLTRNMTAQSELRMYAPKLILVRVEGASPRRNVNWSVILSAIE
jgi:hypothetical protein